MKWLGVTVLVVTGGASGIGRAVIELAARRGFHVAVLDLAAAGARSSADAAEAAGAPASLGLVCNVREADEVSAAFAEVERRLGPLDALCCSAGIDRGGLAHEIGSEQWEAVLGTNLTGTFNACQSAVRSFLRDGRPGSIVCVGSPAGEVALPRAPAYCASKAGVAALVRSLAVDYARNGIRVNGVLPGPTDTALMWANVPAPERAAIEATIAGEVPIGRLARPDEIASTILVLLSDDASYTTGSLVGCDGGTLAKASLSV